GQKKTFNRESVNIPILDDPDPMQSRDPGRLTQRVTRRYGFFFLSTLFPITPPRIPPTAAPMSPPFTLFRLVVAPMTAPAAAPIAASRCVCFSTVPPLDRVVVVACRVVPDDVVLR